MKIEFSKNFYKKEAIEESKKAYEKAGIGDFKIKDTNEKIIVNISKVEKKVEKTAKKEFSNYVLAKMRELI